MSVPKNEPSIFIGGERYQGFDIYKNSLNEWKTTLNPDIPFRSKREVRKFIDDQLGQIK